jgi:hypothetical protein
MSRAWLDSFDDPGVRADLRRAARACMADTDDCDPDLCGHPSQRITPMEFVDWLEQTWHTRTRGVARDDQRDRPRARCSRRHLEVVR